MATKITTRVLADNAVTDAKIADVTLTTATQSASDNTTKIATTAYVTTAIANLADSAPSTLNTLNELAAALGDDANYATTTTNAIAGKLPLAGGTLTGALTIQGATTTIGNSVANTNVEFNLNGVASKATRIQFREGGANKWLLGQGAASETSAFELYNASGTMALSVNRSTNVATFAAGVSAGTASNLKGYFYESTVDQNGTGKPSSVLGLAANIDARSEGPSIDFNAIWGGAGGYQQDNWNEGWTVGRIAGVYDLAGLDTGALAFYTQTSGSSGGASSSSLTEKMRINSSGNVGIGTNNPDSKLHVHGVGALLSSDSYFVAQIQTDRNDDGSNDDGILQFVNGSSKTVKGEIRFDESTNTFELGHGDNQNHLVIASGGNVGIGAISPGSALEISAAANTEPLKIRAATDGYNYSTIFNAAGDSVAYFGLANALVPGGATTDFAIRAQVGELAFATNGNNERMRIDSDGTVSTSLGSNVSTVSGSTAQLIHWNPDEIKVPDSSTGSASYRDMHSFTAHKSGPLRVRWEGANQSGSYYWAGRFLVDGVQMKKTDGSNALHYFASSLASGSSAAVHSFRSFEMDLASVKPGQVIKYQMVSANGSGGPVDGNGQKNRLRSFAVYSTTPTNMGMPVIGYTQGGATAAHQDMTGLTIGSLGVDNKGGIALKTQFALQNEWNDICVIGNGMTGVTFLINATRDLDQNRQKTALVRYAYNQNFTEIAGGHQNTSWEYRYSDNRIQYRFTSAGNYLVQIMVMAGG